MARFWPLLVNFGPSVPTPSIFCRCWSDVCQHRSTFGEHQPALVELNQVLVKRWPKLAKFGATVVQICPMFGRGSAPRQVTSEFAGSARGNLSGRVASLCSPTLRVTQLSLPSTASAGPPTSQVRANVGPNSGNIGGLWEDTTLCVQGLGRFFFDHPRRKSRKGRQGPIWRNRIGDLDIAIQRPPPWGVAGVLLRLAGGCRR